MGLKSCRSGLKSLPSAPKATKSIRDHCPSILANRLDVRKCQEDKGHAWTALKSSSALLEPEGMDDAAPPPMPMRYAGPPILTMSMPTSGSSFFR